MTLVEHPVQAPPTLRRWRWTLEDYLRLGEHRIADWEIAVEEILP